MKDLPVDDKIEELLDQHFSSRHSDDDELFDEEESLEFLMGFKDFEDVIMLSNRLGLDELSTKLYYFEGKYYLYTEFPEDLFDEDEIDDILSILLEYGKKHRLRYIGYKNMEKK